MSLFRAISNTSAAMKAASHMPAVMVPARQMGKKKAQADVRRDPDILATTLYIQNGKLLDPRRVSKKTKGVMKLLAQSEKITVIRERSSFIRPKNSLRDLMLRIRLQHWDEWRVAQPSAPEIVPYDVDLKMSLWPGFKKYCTYPVILFRTAWRKYTEPCYIKVTKVFEGKRGMIMHGLHVWRGITHPRVHRIRAVKKNDWRLYDNALGPINFESWGISRLGRHIVLPVPNCFNKDMEAPYLAAKRASRQELVDSLKQKFSTDN